VDGLSDAALAAARSDFAVEKLLAKPAIGANADDAYVLAGGDDENAARAVAALGARDALIQPFLESVLEEGEYSLFYFGGDYSHAIRKRPAAGDFRVQEEHGGDIRPVVPDAATLEAGQACLRALGETLLYARVDLIRLPDGTMAVMEVELIEPSLYFDQDALAASRFAAKLDEMAFGD
jgi:glutathione synthase/RimK-type ligase-like ATP-grasp enzyme